MKNIKTAEAILKKHDLISDDGYAVEASLVEIIAAMEEYAGQFKAGTKREGRVIELLVAGGLIHKDKIQQAFDIVDSFKDTDTDIKEYVSNA